MPIRASHLRRACLALVCAASLLDVASAAAGAPQITLTGHPQAITRARTTTIPFRAHGHPTSVTCSLDGGRARACRGPARLGHLGYGPHRLRVRAVNAHGSVTVTIHWTVLQTPPSAVESTPVEVPPPALP